MHGKPDDFSPADAIRLPPSGGRRPLPKRLLVAVSSVIAAVLGAAPPVLHDVGPLSGEALLGGAAGSILFALLGLVVALPVLLRVRRRTGSWRLPAALLSFLVMAFVLATLIAGAAFGARAR